MRARPAFIAVLVGVAGVVVFATAGARAQERFDIDRFDPPPSADDGLTIARPETLGAGRLSLRLALDYAHAPLVVDARNGGRAGDPLGAIVAHRLVGHLLFAIGAGDRLE